MIDGIQDVFYFVSDMDRAVAFYRALLGREPTVATTHWTAFDIGGTKFALHWAEGAVIPRLSDADHGSPAGATITFKVSDIDDAARHVRALGAEIVGDIQRSPWGDLLTFRDPDGNVLKLMRPPA